MNDIRDILAQLGLSEYGDAFVSEGFDSWETLSDITESDFNHLNVKLGHRRKIQRAIADWSAQFGRPPLHLPTVNATSQLTSHLNHQAPDRTGKLKANDTHQQQQQQQHQRLSQPQWNHGPTPTIDGGHASNPEAGYSNDALSEGKRTKRKYRRHPKPDKNAPQRPQSAYVIFSNHLREQLKAKELSFTDMAKVVGEQWQVLDAATREICESQASAAKEQYYAELAIYKKTDKYAQYQEYLQEFKEKYGDQGTDDKRIKLKAEASNSTQSSNEACENQQPGYRVGSSSYAMSATSDTHQDGYSQTTSPVSSHMGQRRSPFDELDTRRTYPANRSINGLTRQSSAGSSGDRTSTGTEQDGVYYNTIPPYSAKLPPASSLYQHPSSSAATPPLRGPPPGVLPAQDQSGSPNSSLGGILAAPRSDRVLPALSTSIAHGLPPPHRSDAVEHKPGPPRLAHYSSSSSSTSNPDDPRQSASLAALLRAGEIASREANRRPSQQSRYNP